MTAKFVALIVEADDLHRETLAAVLTNEGLEVVECSTAEAAELIVATTGTELRALVTDQNLRGVMTGAELVQFARDKFPNLKAIIMSASGKPPPLPPDVHYLRKPFAPTEFLALVLA